MVKVIGNCGTRESTGRQRTAVSVPWDDPSRTRRSSDMQDYVNQKDALERTAVEKREKAKRDREA